MFMTSRVQETQSWFEVGNIPSNAMFFESNSSTFGVKTSCDESRRSSEARFVVFEEESLTTQYLPEVVSFWHTAFLKGPSR